MTSGFVMALRRVAFDFTHNDNLAYLHGAKHGKRFADQAVKAWDALCEFVTRASADEIADAKSGMGLQTAMDIDAAVKHVIASTQGRYTRLGA